MCIGPVAVHSGGPVARSIALAYNTGMARILVGTCGWTDPTLLEPGLFYPVEAKTAEARLQFYASRFPLVEVDSTYYALPSEKTAGLWVERTPAGFIFDIKAYALFTGHPTPVRSLPKDLREALPGELAGKPFGKLRTGSNVYYDKLPPELREEAWARFVQALLPLDSAGKLGLVLLQFPPWFLPSQENREHILEAKAHLGQYRAAVEFRNASWLAPERAERTLAFLRDNGLAFVCVDGPQGYKSSIPPLVAATAPVAVLRLHGHNKDNWEKRGITTAERFRYLYSEEELRELAGRVRQLAQQAQEVHVLFNNCYADYAVRNGSQMQKLLEE